jgi:hypothetical protein
MWYAVSMREVPINLLREKLLYNEGTGALLWKNTTQWTKSGQVAGTNCNGYIKISINQKIIPAHRIVWAMLYGTWPFGEIDHIDGNRSNNKACNLREVTRQQNCMNRAKAVNNKTGRKGVSWHAGAKKWQAHISVAGKSIYLGLFASAEDAGDEYARASEKAYGLFKRHG